MIAIEEISRVALLKLSERLQLASANELYADARNLAWMPVVGGEEIALWIRNFDHLYLFVSDIAEGASLAQRFLIKLARLHHRSTDHMALQAALSEAEVVGLRLCATIGKRFVSDLPVPCERLATVGHLSPRDRKEIDSFGPPKAADDGDESQPWSAIDDEYLIRFSPVSPTVGDLTALREEITRARHDGQEPGWETSVFAAARVFRGKVDTVHCAHTAMTRMVAMSRLTGGDAIEVRIENSNGPGVGLVPKNVLHAMARCLLIRVGNDPGSEVVIFRNLALELAVRTQRQ